MEAQTGGTFSHPSRRCASWLHRALVAGDETPLEWLDQHDRANFHDGRELVTMMLSVSDVVEVGRAEEILRTMDGSDELGGIPFMHEMLAYCRKHSS